MPWKAWASGVGCAAGTKGDGFVDFFDDDLSVYAFEYGW
jgi:hypothetical protein